jgi:hypothetical protein
MLVYNCSQTRMLAYYQFLRIEECPQHWSWVRQCLCVCGGGGGISDYIAAFLQPADMFIQLVLMLVAVWIENDHNTGARQRGSLLPVCSHARTLNSPPLRPPTTSSMSSSSTSLSGKKKKKKKLTSSSSSTSSTSSSTSSTSSSTSTTDF